MKIALFLTLFMSIGAQLRDLGIKELRDLGI
jgi:hypothetical protein